MSESFFQRQQQPGEGSHHSSYNINSYYPPLSTTKSSGDSAILTVSESLARSTYSGFNSGT